MIIPVAEVRRKARRYVGEAPADLLELESDAFVRPRGPVRYDLWASLIVSELLVRGTLEVEVTCQCARCAEAFDTVARVPEFCRSYPVAEENESIDLSGDLREELLLAFPINWMCLPACRGLCPHCGVNKNRQPCACQEAPPATPWDALDRWRKPS